ncbi:MAG: patatin, partial [Frankiales bacterium]|nr:patatin [Frankiales bacterium]
LTPPIDLDALVSFFMTVGDISGGVPPEVAVKVGVFAQEAQTPPIEERREVIAWRLPSHEWPSAPFLVTTADTRTGELVVLDKASGVPLVDAVMASCAVPGVWPPVPLLGRVLIDGGVLSLTHLALAAGHDQVLVLVPMAGPVMRMVENEVAGLRAAGASVTVISADQQTVDAMGPNALDPAMRPAAAEAGLRQGRVSG